MPRPRSLTPEQIADAALAVVDRHGTGDLTMRAVATELGLSTMSLYRYVTGKDQLEALVVDRVLAQVSLDPPDAPWPDQLTALVTRVWTAVTAHPGVVPLTLVRRQDSTAIPRWAETVLGVLNSAGITGEPQVIALRTLLAYLIGAIQLQHLGPLAGEGTARMAALPPDRFPHLSATGRTAQGIDPDTEFRRGLALVIGGLSSAPEP